MLYLYLFVEAEPHSLQAVTPPTAADLTLVRAGCLFVYRWYGNAYEKLILDTEGKQEKLVWVTVPTAEIITDAVEDIGEYHG